MKIFYVSDNRTTPNWGCRATSVALAENLAERGEIVGTLYNDLKKNVLLANTPLPAFLVNIVDRKIGHGRLGAQLIKRAPQLGEALDFVASDCEETAQRILRQAPRFSVLNDIVTNIRKADVVYINGEGNMIFTRWRRSLRFLLGLIALAKANGKPVIFGNAMISDPPKGAPDQPTLEQCLKALRMCVAVGARDPESHKIASRMMDLGTADFIPDALFHWFDKVSHVQVGNEALGQILLPFGEEKAFGTFDFSHPYIALGGSSGGRNLDKAKLQQIYCQLVQELQTTGCRVYLFESCEGDRFLREVGREMKIPVVPVSVPILLATIFLSRARLIVSGRYHPSIMASLGGTPPICFGSNSHKMHSLQRVLGLENPKEFSFPPEQSELPSILQRAQAFLEEGDTLRERIKAQAAENARQFRRKTAEQLASCE